MTAKLKFTHLDAKRDQGRELPLLVVGDIPLLGSGLALARRARFLKWIGSGCFSTGMTEIARLWISYHRVPCLHEI